MEQRVWDFHIHPFSRNEENICMYPLAVTTPAEALSDLRRQGISRVSGTVLPPYTKEAESFDFCREANRHALKLKEQWGEFYVPGFHIHPAFVRESCEEIEFMHKNGLRLIGELVPYRCGWRFDDPRLAEILSLAEEYGMILSVHANDDDPARFRRMAEEHPRLTVVAAHPGERSRYGEHLTAMEACENYYLDISGTGLFRYGMLRYGIDRVGSERILFGSDYPICNAGMNLAGVFSESLTDGERENILWNNAARLLSE